MPSFIHNRRGSISLAFALTAIPLIGIAALGTEAGSWYITKRHAQNAADASAYAGGLTLALGEWSETSARNVATANGFTDGYSPSAGTTQSVNITPGGSSVTANITVKQPTLLVSVLCVGRTTCSLKDVTISAQATASVNPAQNVCFLALKRGNSTLTLGGSGVITGNGCSMMSAGGIKLNSAPTLPDGMTLLAVEGCEGPSCTDVPQSNYHALPPTNPLSALDQPGAIPAPAGGAPKPCSGKGCGEITLNPGNYSSLSRGNGDNVVLKPGT